MENITIQAKEEQICAVTSGAVDTTLIGSATNLTNAYRKANLLARSKTFQNFSNGSFVHVRGESDGDTGTLELWGYPINGDAEFLGEYTWVTDSMVDADGQFYVDEFTEVTAGQHKIRTRNMSDGKAILKWDSLGFRNVVALLTVVSAGTAKVYIRPW